jgi:hypothetical protein
MNSAPLRSPAFAVGLLLASVGLAQSPAKAPPWWAVSDNVTVSLYYSFDSATPFQPTFEVHGGAWYNPLVTHFTVPPNITVLPTFQGHTGVVALVGTGVLQSALLTIKIDNDPYPDWIKLFTIQYDEFESASGSLSGAIAKSLAYKRAIIKETSEPIGGGWNRVTIEAQLIPQPTDEDFDWTFVETALGTSAIDNLYVNSKCVKPMPDETGDALGTREGFVNLSSLGLTDLHGAAVTEGPAPAFQKHYWFSRGATAVGAQHTLLRINASPPYPTTLTVSLSSTPQLAPQGPGDLAVQSIVVGGVVTQQIVWVVLDNRATGGGVLLQGVDSITGTSTLLPLVGFPPSTVIATNQILGLAYDPSGAVGAGTFMVSGTTAATQGLMLEFSSVTGNLLNTYPIASGCSGLGYDDSLGNFYGFSNTSQPTPGGPIETNGIEFSGYELDTLPPQFRPTGVRFCGDLTILNGAGPRGGSAAGFEVYRSRANLTAPLSLVCLVETPNNPVSQLWIYELAGPFGFGWSVLGRCGMRDTGPFHGIPFVGTTMEVTLTDVPHALFATMFLGFSNTSFPGGPLPLDLSAILGWPESVLSVSPDVNTPLLLPSAPGEFSFPVPIPPSTTLAYAPVFFQWLALDSSIQGFFAMSQAGKTVIYP